MLGESCTPEKPNPVQRMRRQAELEERRDGETDSYWASLYLAQGVSVMCPEVDLWVNFAHPKLQSAVRQQQHVNFGLIGLRQSLRRKTFPKLSFNSAACVVDIESTASDVDRPLLVGWCPSRQYA